MKFINIVVIALLIFTSCIEDNSLKSKASLADANTKLKDMTTFYPETISKILDAHGGIDLWIKMQTLTFTTQKESGNEVTTTDLKNRYSIIEMPKHNIGYDGKNVWLQSKGNIPYEGNPKFYYNLMFYFYAMPFVVADDGIMYEDVDPLIFENKIYPGVKISYDSGIGESPEDEYIVYYDPETGMMVWLAYTVTYFTKEKSEKWAFINYNEWQVVNAIKLPKQLTWYAVEDNVPTTKRNAIDFVDIVLTASSKGKNTFAMPIGAKAFK
jgi:hypothetical protein